MNGPHDDPMADAGHLSSRELVDAVWDDLRSRFAAGERPEAEAYLARFPQLTAKPDLVVDVIYAEFLLRREHGETVAAEGFLQRFPDYSELLSRQFLLHAWEDDSLRGKDRRLRRTPP
jgi:hypothetical protein